MCAAYVQTAIEASEDDCQLASETEADSQTDNDLSDWFGQLARPLLKGSDAGYALHLATGFLPGTCARYVAKSEASRRQPPGYFIVTLLRSEQGATWLAAFMGDSSVRWWRERKAIELKAINFDKLSKLYNVLAAELRE